MKWIGVATSGNYIVEVTQEEWASQLLNIQSPSSIGPAIKEHRDMMGLTQQQMAEKIDISRTYLSMIERGVADNYSLVVYKKILGELGKR